MLDGHQKLSPHRARQLVAAAALFGSFGCSAEALVDEGRDDVAFVGAARGELDVTDVSVLYPLSSPADLIPATAALPTGSRLLPETLKSAMPELVPGSSPTESFAALKVVGIRFDPCAPGPKPCQGEIRFVLQPVSSAGGSVVVEDAGVHVVYRLGAEKVFPLALALRDLRRTEPSDSVRKTLGPHPILSSKGIRSSYGTKLRALALETAGKGTLSRVTFFSVRGRGNSWSFTGVDVAKDGRFTSVPIPGVSGPAQGVVLNRGGRSFSRATNPPGDTADFAVLLDSLGTLDATPVAWKSAIQATLDIENPTVHDVNTTDCASCHMATSARMWAVRNSGVPMPGGLRPFVDDGFALALDPGPVVARPDSFRAFGYFSVPGESLPPAPVVSQRTMNDSAASARTFARLLK